MDYDMIMKLVLLFVLCICAVTDWLYHQIWIPVFVPFVLTAVFCMVQEQENLLLQMVICLSVVLLFMAISIVTQGQIGKGDGILLGISLLGMEVWAGVTFLFFSFAYAFLFSLFLVVVRRKSKNFRIPLAPFVLLGYGTCLWMEYSI